MSAISWQNTVTALWTFSRLLQLLQSKTNSKLSCVVSALQKTQMLTVKRGVFVAEVVVRSSTRSDKGDFLQNKWPNT